MKYTLKKMGVSKLIIGIVSGIVTIVWAIFLLYLFITEQTHVISYEVLLGHISPQVWGTLGFALSIGLSIIGAGCGIWIIGTSLLGSSVAALHVKTKNLISVLFCEAIAIYGIVISYVISTKLNATYNINKVSIYTGYALFWSGFTIGVCDLACGISVGMIGSSAALADAQNPSLFIRILVIEIFTSAVGLFGWITSLILINKVENFST